jgi:hypothetical protein
VDTEEQGGVRSLDYIATFWAQCDPSSDGVSVMQNDCVEIDGEIFRALDDQNFMREGNFVKVLMERFTGVTDQQVTNTQVDRVIKNDY